MTLWLRLFRIENITPINSTEDYNFRILITSKINNNFIVTILLKDFYWGVHVETSQSLYNHSSNNTCL